MKLDEAIRYAEEQADLLEESAQGCDLTDRVEQEIACKSGKCAAEHRQLAEWLKDYKRLLEQIEDIKAEIEEDKKKAVNYALNTADLTERYAHLRMETAYAIALAVIDKHLGKDGENE